MEGFTLIDAVVTLVIVVSALLAFSRGLTREILAIGGWILAAILAFIFAPDVKPLIREIPYLGDFLADSCELETIAAFAVVFAAALILSSLITPFFSSSVQHSPLSGLDQGFGFLFGVLRGIALVAIAFFIYDAVLSSQSVAMVDESRSAQVFGRITNQIDEKDPEKALSWITGQYEQLVGACEG